MVPESKNINANPGKMGGKGYEPKRVYEFTDKTSASLALGALAKKFPKVFLKTLKGSFLLLPVTILLIFIT